MLKQRLKAERLLPGQLETAIAPDAPGGAHPGRSGGDGHGGGVSQPSDQRGGGGEEACSRTVTGIIMRSLPGRFHAQSID